MVLWRIARVVCIAFGFLSLLGLVVLPTTQVVMRGVFTMPIVGLEEVTRYLLIFLTFICVPLVVADGGQIRMEEFLALTPAGARRRARAAIALLSCGTMLMLVWSIHRSVEANVGSHTPTVGIPFWIFMLPALLGLLLGAIGYVLLAIGWLDDRPGDGPPAL